MRLYSNALMARGAATAIAHSIAVPLPEPTTSACRRVAKSPSSPQCHLRREPRPQRPQTHRHPRQVSLTMLDFVQITDHFFRRLVAVKSSFFVVKLQLVHAITIRCELLARLIILVGRLYLEQSAIQYFEWRLYNDFPSCDHGLGWCCIHAHTCLHCDTICRQRSLQLIKRIKDIDITTDRRPQRRYTSNSAAGCHSRMLAVEAAQTQPSVLRLAPGYLRHDRYVRRPVRGTRWQGAGA